MPAIQSSGPPLVSRSRLGLAVLTAVFTAAFNYGSEIRTIGDAALWLGLGLAVSYPTLTAVRLLEDRIW